MFDEAFGRMEAAPDAYCYYTVEFIEALDKHWPDLIGRKRRRVESLSERRCLVEHFAEKYPTCHLNRWAE